MKKWTILQVNFKSFLYIKWQLKILYEFNPFDIFELIIIDNSCDNEEFSNLSKLVEPYKLKYGNILLLKYTPSNKTSSGQHGEAIEFSKKYINSKFLLIHDPDFFWLRKNYLSYLEKLLVSNFVVGAPYPKKVNIGQEYFPSAFGCAYHTNLVKNISFLPYIDNDYEKSWNEYYALNYDKKNYDFYYDVGWLVRKELSDILDDNFISFSQLNIKNNLGELLELKENYSFETNTRIYYHNNKVIASHLFRGSHTGKVIKNKDPNLKLSKNINNSRDLIGEFMFNQIKNDNEYLNNIAIYLENISKINFTKILLNKNLILLLIKMIFYSKIKKIKRTKFLNFLIPIKTKKIIIILEKIKLLIQKEIYD